MSLQIPAITHGKEDTAVTVSDTVFGQDFNEPLVHQLVVSYLASARSGTKAQKSRSDVSGGGTKPWKQKGSGRARAGTTRSPLWRTGGVTFAASNRSYKQKLNKKMYRAGMRSIFSELLRQDRLIVSDDVFPSAPKTRELANRLKDYEDGRILIITDAVNSDLFLAARNLSKVEVCITNSLSPVALVNSDKVIVTTLAIKLIEEKLGMKEQDLIRVLQAPVISEKSTLLAEEHKKFVFKVKKSATKMNIKQAVELMFNVKVDSVHVLNVKGKTKRFGRFIGSRSDWKKAYIKLKPGFDIDLSIA